MRLSAYYVPTLKEAPSDAEVISHKLLVRAGMIRKLTSGIYTWLPLGLRVLNKAANLVRKGMDEAGCCEILMPMVQPADLWEESGRYTKYGKELLRFVDRHDRPYCLGPTHEEVITDLLRGEVRSYRQLPVSLYQIQTKFRDEIRPRFGLMRGREFLMKDAYTFDATDEAADKSYFTMKEAYSRIFTSMGLDFRPVEADSGAIGGNFSHEFMVLADTGEDVIASCTAWPECEFAANIERAPAVAEPTASQAERLPVEDVPTPGAHTIEEVSACLKLGAEHFVKTLLYMADGKIIAALVRGDRELNEIKLKKVAGVDDLVFATPEQVQAATGAPVGFAGPVGLKVSALYADNGLKSLGPWITGANKADTHTKNVWLDRDVSSFTWADLRNVVAGDACPHCGAPLELKRGIEVGHVFKLGTKYSEAMKAVYVDENGEEKYIIMGCYGIGVSRVVAACIEQNHDENGICFPAALAPYDIALLNLDPKNADVANVADTLYGDLKAAGFDVLYDDREERPGVKFKDADLIGLPVQVVIGAKGITNGIAEIKNRRTAEKSTLPLADFMAGFQQYWKNL